MNDLIVSIVQMDALGTTVSLLQDVDYDILLDIKVETERLLNLRDLEGSRLS